MANKKNLKVFVKISQLFVLRTMFIKYVYAEKKLCEMCILFCLYIKIYKVPVLFLLGNNTIN